MKKISDMIRVIIGEHDKRESAKNVISDVSTNDNTSVEIIINETDLKD